MGAIRTVDVNDRFICKHLRTGMHEVARTGWSMSGIGDEAGLDIRRQIQAHKLLGWNYIEPRKVNNIFGDPGNIVTIDDTSFEGVAQILRDANMRVSGLASGIANWEIEVTKPIKNDIALLERAIPRMETLDTRFIRIMSWKWKHEAGKPLVPENEIGPLVISRMRELIKPLAGTNIVALIENCAGWAGDNAANFLRLMEEVDSPNLGFLYDTGNPVSYEKDPWELYQGVKPYIYAVHLKDARWEAGQNSKTYTIRDNMAFEDSETYTYLGKGQGMVKEIVTDLLKSGYCGIFSSEPHIAAVIHKAKTASQEELFGSYLLYGLGINKFMSEIEWEIKLGGFALKDDVLNFAFE
ncbi:MAG: sugar phosphate isomerase/epimerase family protein [Candidatus Margulisiibacteriota bacterium]